MKYQEHKKQRKRGLGLHLTSPQRRVVGDKSIAENTDSGGQNVDRTVCGP